VQINLQNHAEFDSTRRLAKNTRESWQVNTESEWNSKVEKVKHRGKLQRKR